MPVLFLQLKQECIPVGCVLPTRNRVRGLPDRDPPDKDPPCLDRDPSPSLRAVINKECLTWRRGNLTLHEIMYFK